jgi:FKBP-type peptidyl-prolyl cis-trans isomerase (trigger factor)
MHYFILSAYGSFSMTTQIVENIGKLERRMTLSVTREAVQQEVQVRIRQLAKRVRLPGFRPGKAPLKIITQQYTHQVEIEVLDDKINQTFLEMSRAHNLKIAGRPAISIRETGDNADVYAFDATFEVYPEVRIGDVGAAQVIRTTAPIGEADIDRMLEILQKQKAQYHTRPSSDSPEDARSSGSPDDQEAPSLPPVDTQFALSLGIADGNIETLRAQIKENLMREAKRRTQLLLRQQVMDRLLEITEFDVPMAWVDKEQQQLAENFAAQYKRAGMPDQAGILADTALFREQAVRRVKLMLILSELINTHHLQATPEQVSAEIDVLTQSYDDPQAMRRWYDSDQARIGEVAASVTENNVVDFILEKAQITDTQVSFETLINTAT